MKENIIRVLKVEPQKPPEVVNLENTLPAMQKAVGGLIEIIEIESNVCILCNEEGKLIGLEPNRRFGNDILVGTFYITGADEKGNLTSLSDQQLQKYAARFAQPEVFNKDTIDPFLEFIKL